VWMIACQPVDAPPVDVPTQEEAPAPVIQMPVAIPAPVVVLPEAGACDGELADVPTALFKDRVLVRLPIGVEVNEVSSASGSMVARTGAGESVSTCGAAVRHVAIGLVAAASERALEAVRDQVFADVHGAAAGAIQWQDVVSDERGLEGSYSVGPIRGWFVLKKKHGDLVWALYEASPDAYTKLAPTFRMSSKRLLVVPGA